MLYVKTPSIPSDEFMKRAVGVAIHYGFMPWNRVRKEVNRTRTKKPAAAKKPIKPRGAFGSHTGELHQALQTYVDHGFNTLAQPVLFYHSNIERGMRGVKADDPLLLGLQVIGSNKSISEAILIKTAIEILDEVGIKNVSIHVNTIGDRDGVARYNRELVAYLRKNINDMPAHARTLLKRNSFQCLTHLCQKKHPIADEAPRAMEFLAEHGRKHLKEVLEYIEGIGLSYEIDDTLVGDGESYSQMLFEIREKENDEDPLLDQVVYARGGRYDDFGRKLYRMNIPAAGIIIKSGRKGGNPKVYLNPKRIRQPKVCFIQFGFEARLKSLRVLEMLRKAKIPVQQSFGSDKLTDQLEWAERCSIPHIIIMGQKEAIDGTIIVRDMNTRSQEIIDVENLSVYLKSIWK